MRGKTQSELKLELLELRKELEEERAIWRKADIEAQFERFGILQTVISWIYNKFNYGGKK